LLRRRGRSDEKHINLFRRAQCQTSNQSSETTLAYNRLFVPTSLQTSTKKTSHTHGRKKAMLPRVLLPQLRRAWSSAAPLQQVSGIAAVSGDQR
jgi:hypothetical protein